MRFDAQEFVLPLVFVVFSSGAFFSSSSRAFSFSFSFSYTKTTPVCVRWTRPQDAPQPATSPGNGSNGGPTLIWDCDHVGARCDTGVISFIWFSRFSYLCSKNMSSFLSQFSHPRKPLYTFSQPIPPPIAHPQCALILFFIL